LSRVTFQEGKEEREKMKLRRFKIDKECLRGLEATITDEGEIRHLAKVLRLKAGDEVILFDGEGKEYHASLTRLSPREISLRLLREPSSVVAESPLKIILGVGLLKSSKLDWLIQKTTELGVAEVVPFYSLHVVPQWEESRARLRQSRWEKIASEAAKQCGRAQVPKIHSPRSFEEVLVMKSEEATKILLWEKEPAGSLKNVSPSTASAIYALIGPEGGFSDEEALRARGAGFQPIRLGPRVLRAETAGIVIVSLLQFVRGDLS
jgi:16S rRNA (uracil1498-N3)-methyltransferase